MLYQITHVFDVDGGFGDAVEKSETVGFVEATEEQIAEYLKEWDKPRVYDRPYNALYEHHVVAVPVKITELSDVVPYHNLWADDDDEEDEFEEEEKEDRLELEIEGRLTGTRYHM